MANPTTYFGWVMPTSTDLVTDLPADFNVFGQGVDTSMQDLLGGTTGQVLSKTSNTNMDFTWVTPTDQTPLTTKGDLFTFTTVDARLGIGTNDQVLTADSAQATGMKWATPVTSSYTLLTSGNLPTGANTVTISSLSSAYQDLVIEIYGVTFGTAAGYGVFTGGAWGRGSGTILNADTSTGDAYSGTYPRFVDKTWTTQTANIMSIRIFNYTATYRKAYSYSGLVTDSSTTWGTTFGGGIDNATAISAITIQSIFGGSPNFTAGSYKIWGVK